MSFKKSSVSNPESKITRCKTCRQDIATEKMFLHEGFCQRNNVFCEHCEKVFLKNDYDEHLKDLRNSINSSKSTAIDENEPIPVVNVMPVIKQSITTTINPNTIYEYVEMPFTEEYKVNNPIVISESGSIISSQNKNEFILPSLGINAMHDDFGINYDKYFLNLADAKFNYNYSNKNEVFNNYININTSNSFIYNNNYQQNTFYNTNNNLNNFYQKPTNQKKNYGSKTYRPRKEPNYNISMINKESKASEKAKNLFPKDSTRKVSSMPIKTKIKNLKKNFN